MITLSNVGKRFRLYDRPWDRVREWIGMGGRHQDFWALRGVDLEVPRGRTVGIVGPNGAGKSTLLKLITGTLLPTTGSIAVDGRVAALLELGTGFHGEFTGRQNIWINGRLLGLTHGEIAGHEREIIAFSELGRFIDQPIRTYSSGMVVRLGFSIAASVNPQVLIIDEALSVGDARFSQKCIRRIRQFRESGCTILFVSHDAHAVSTLCDEAVLLEEGTVVQRGTPADVLEHYNALLAAKGEGNVEMKVHWASGTGVGDAAAPRRTGTFQAVVLGVRMQRDGRDCDVFAPGDRMTLGVSVLFLAPVEDPTIGFLIRDRLGVDIYGTNTRLQGLALGSPRAGDVVHLSVELPLELGDGDYSVTVAVHQDETHLEACYDWTDRLALFRVRSGGRHTFAGRVRLAPRLGVTTQAGTEGDISTALLELFSHLTDPMGAEAEAPAPWLGGFHAPEFPADGGAPFRWTGPRATFVFRPADLRLALVVGVFGPDSRPRPVRLRLASLLAGELGAVDLPGEREVALFDLPPAAAGRADVFTLVVDPPFTEDADAGSRRELGVALYAIRSLDPEAEVPTWHAMIPSR